MMVKRRSSWACGGEEHGLGGGMAGLDWCEIVRGGDAGATGSHNFPVFQPSLNSEHTHGKSKSSPPGVFDSDMKINKEVKIWRLTLPEYLNKDQDLVKD
ncbi:hypothetical protein M0R45_032603 [Rubus argutus]|uniref:Uncharacterized protein n=1 Tax=Rubus argutus TaxID=59490 RepID=A0AAW1WKA2_RUBAR